jgi:DNA-binding response OmpR family regulator
VETVVNRLRRRLDSTAVRIMTVHKRGYCLAPA